MAASIVCRMSDVCTHPDPVAARIRTSGISVMKYTHDLRATNWGVFCVYCRSAARTVPSLRQLMYRACKPILPNSCEQGRIHSSHSVSVSGPLVWCISCVAFCVKRIVKLSLPCNQFAL